MMYVGITVYVEEACRLFGISPPVDDASYAKVVAQIESRSSLRLYSIDKGVLVLGLEVPEIERNLWAPARSVDECIAIIQLRKHEWLREIARLKFDMASVTLAHMEDDNEIVDYPQPTLIIS